MAKELSITQRIMAETADEVLTAWLTNGVEKWTGQLDAQGNPIMVREVLSAAQMRCVLTRLAQLGIDAVPTPGSSAGRLVDAARARGIGVSIQAGTKPAAPPPPPAPIRPLPSLSEDDDDATR